MDLSTCLLNQGLSIRWVPRVGWTAEGLPAVDHAAQAIWMVAWRQPAPGKWSASAASSP
jgi:hypothetical protein